MEVLGALQGLTYTLPDLYRKISEHGWEIKKVKYDKATDQFIATGKAPHGEEVDGWGPNERQAVSNLLHHVVLRNSMRTTKLGSWSTNFTDQLVPIAEAYAKAPVYEPKAATSFMELARDCVSRSKTIQDQLTVTIVNDPEPYKSSEKMCDDIRKRRQLIVSAAGIEHPIWSRDEVLAYRICHDVLGYCAVNAGFDWEGENRAFAAHAAVVPHEAQQALFTESVAQTAYATYYRSYGPQKVCVLKEFIDPAQDKENPHKGYRGIHPSQMFLPSKTPAAKPPFKSSVIHEAKAVIKPMADGRLPVDINANYNTAHSPEMYGLAPYDQAMEEQPGYPNLGLNEMNDVIQGNPEKGIAGLHTDWTRRGSGGVATGWDKPSNMSDADVAAEWQEFKKEEPEGAVHILTAVSNAIRVACLSPKTLLHQNAQQYQDLQGVPYNCTDPNVYWNALEGARQNWNAARFGEQARFEHQPWNAREDLGPAEGQSTNPKGYAPIIKLAMVIYERNPQLGQDGARREALEEIQQMKHRFQEMLIARNEGTKGEDTGLDGAMPLDQRMWIVDNESNKLVLKWIKMVTDESTPHDEWQQSADTVENEFDPKSAAAKDPNAWPFAPTKSPLLKEKGEDGKVNPITQYDYGKDPSFEGYDNHKINNMQRYGAFMGTSIQAICQLTARLDEITEAALIDVHAHDGTGHNFRTYMLSIGANGTGPKIISFLWLLLQPLTSQLATIDVHMSAVLGYEGKSNSGKPNAQPKSESDAVPNERDYFRLERELQARRDALGLQRVPLGQFQWAIWDLQRTGVQDPTATDVTQRIALHQDHSFMRPVDPVPASQVKVIPKSPKPPKGTPAPPPHPIIQATDPAANAERDNFVDTVAKDNPAGGQIPTQAEWPVTPGLGQQYMAKLASTPWAVHPETGERLQGFEGQTIMQYLRSLGLNVGDIWNKFPDEAVGKV